MKAEVKLPFQKRYATIKALQRDLLQMGTGGSHVTIWRWVHASLLNQGVRRELRRPHRSWRVDETCVRVAGN